MIHQKLTPQILKLTEDPNYNVEEWTESMRYALGYDAAMFLGEPAPNHLEASESYKMGFADGMGDKDAN